jgi:hypothetical protein
MNYSKSAFRVPGYLPYESPVENPLAPVPNQAQCFWPHGQLAPEFLPPGSSSAQPFVFPTFKPSDVLYGEKADGTAINNYGDAMGAEWAEKYRKPLTGVVIISIALLLWTKPWQKKPDDYDGW